MIKERRGMLARSVNRTDRKSAAQRSRDLFATLAGSVERSSEPALTVSRIRPRRAEPTGSEVAAAVEAVESMSVEPMSLSRLTVVPSSPAAAPEKAPAKAPAADQAAESTAARIRRLQAEAQSLAREEVVGLERKISELAVAARQVAEGGDAYPVGAREIARRLAEDLPRQAGVLEALLRKL
jgi:hypothetical protein